MKISKPVINILWISPYAPYDAVRHAGGQDFNYLLKYLNANNDFNIHVATLCLKDELDKLDFNLYHISNSYKVINDCKIIYHLGLLLDHIAYYNPFHSGGNILTPYTRNCFKNLLKSVKKLNPNPDIIIFHWTQTALLLPVLKKMYPDAKTVMVEVDVAYLGYQRILNRCSSFCSRFLWRHKLKHLRKAELSCSQKSDHIIVLNQKDADILKHDNIPTEKIFVSIPYFHNYTSIAHQQRNLNILFFGYMGREENHLSALWFIQHVMPLLSKEFHFVVIGNEPRNELLQMQNNNIHILGYVEDITPYFQDSLCLTAPLILGAGIKIKILEGLSAGIPVLTNSIGIEGINAVTGQDFFYCETPDEYADTIRLLKDTDIGMVISNNAQKFISRNFNTAERIEKLMADILTS